MRTNPEPSQDASLVAVCFSTAPGFTVPLSPGFARFRAPPANEHQSGRRSIFFSPGKLLYHGQQKSAIALIQIGGIAPYLR